MAGSDGRVGCVGKALAASSSFLLIIFHNLIGKLSIISKAEIKRAAKIASVAQKSNNLSRGKETKKPTYPPAYSSKITSTRPRELNKNKPAPITVETRTREPIDKSRVTPPKKNAK